jgi:hypothetical protein
MLTALWSSVLAFIGQLAGWLQPIIKDVSVDVIKEVAATPEYKSTTKADTVASPAEVERVTIKIKESQLWAELHKK